MFLFLGLGLPSILVSVALVVLDAAIVAIVDVVAVFLLFLRLLLSLPQNNKNKRTVS